jgi:hypothetical protein
MLENGFESRIKIQQIIENQLPEFILDENPKAAEFLKQYYISQEYQSGPVDIAENLDQYLNLDHLIPEVIVDSTTLKFDITSTSTTIRVNTTKGFPQKYGLLQINDEIITYTDSTEDSFIGCIRGFSGITNYQQQELIFNTSFATNHSKDTLIKNLSSLFLKEFYKKIKFSLTPGLEKTNFVENLNVGNFIRNAKTFYQTKGTVESFRILFNVLFGETPNIIDLEQYLFKSSNANYIRRDIAVIDVISGNPSQLVGQTIKKNTDSYTTASVSRVETITRKDKTYYKLYCFVGYDDTYPTITGTFSITESSHVIEDVTISNLPNLSVVTVDSTIGFPESGSFYYKNQEILYTAKTINQFLGCYSKNEEIDIHKTEIVNSNNTYYGYENGDLNRKVEFRITGVLSNITFENDSYSFIENEEISPKNLGEKITSGNTRKQIFANSWVYNTSTRYQVEKFESASIILKTTVDSCNLVPGDEIEILSRDSELVIPNFEDIRVISISQSKQELRINVNTSSLKDSGLYDIRRKIKKASSSIIPIEYGNNTLFSNIQNIYDENSEYMYVASNSLPSYEITTNILKYTAKSVIKNQEFDIFCSIITFDKVISFVTGDKIYYSSNNSQILGLENGIYYVEVLDDKKSIRLYQSRTAISAEDFVVFKNTSNTSLSPNHIFTLYSQYNKKISAQKLLKKFKLEPNLYSNLQNSTIPGSIGMLNNGVEIYNYKSNDKIFYGPLENVEVLNGGSDYDVINPPRLEVDGNALLQPVVSGTVREVYVDPQDFNIDSIIKIELTGGNGTGAVFEPVIEKTARELEFDARSIANGGGLDFNNETITFLQNHNLNNGQSIVYIKNTNNNPIGVGNYEGSNNNQSKSLIDGATYYTKIINDRTIELYENINDYNLGINTVGFTTIGNAGIHKFKTELKNTLKEIKVIHGGQNYTNRKLRVSPSEISTSDYSINYINHGFSDGELIQYSYNNNSITGISTENYYYVLKIDSNKFKLCDAGIGGTIRTNYEQKKYLKFTSSGVGYQIFSYPDIKLNVYYTLAGSENTNIVESITADPVVKGEIVQVYTYQKGSNYGSKILNIHQRPKIDIKNGSGAQFSTLIQNGKIVSVAVQYSGIDYYSTPELIVVGDGIGAKLRAVIQNNKIIDVIILHSGSGYTSKNTSIYAISSGKNAFIQANVRALTVNNAVRYGIQKNSYRNTCSELLLGTDTNLQYSVISYSQNLKNYLNDQGKDSQEHSPIIGWAYDGNPIYGPYGYSDSKNKNSPIKELKTSYVSSNITNRPPVSDFPYGYFVEDYVYDDSGDLDQFNGRFGKTKDFPNGVYAYFATIEINDDGEIVGQFPYFIGNSYRSEPLTDNDILNQSFDFNNSSLIRNTYPYKVNDQYSDNDFIIESNEIVSQKTIVESVSSGSVNGFEIINAGKNYSVGDELVFNEIDTNGQGVAAEVSEVTGVDILNVQTSVTTYNNIPITWENENKLKLTITPYHNFSNGDNIVISGLSNVNGKYTIGVTSFSSTISKSIPNYSSTGKYTDIYLSHIPNNISIGSSIKIDNEIFSVLNTYLNYNIIKAKRSSAGVAHSSGSIVRFLPDSILINKSTTIFNSQNNRKIYFNPTYSLGIGTISGSGISTTYTVGTTEYSIFIPTQNIYLPNHQFKTGQELLFRKETGSSSITVKNDPEESSFNILNENSESLYVINKSKDFIGVVTNIGLTTTSDGVYFITSGSDNYDYSIETKYNPVLVDLNRINTVVSVSTSHNLNYGDQISLTIKPSLSVGIGTSTDIRVKFNQSRNKLLINSIGISSTKVNTLQNSIEIGEHDFNTGDKIFFESNTPPSGLSNSDYFIYKIDENNISLSDTYLNSISTPPVIIDIQSSGLGIHTISLINPSLFLIRNNNVKFNLIDSSLAGYDFNLYADINYTKKFISDGESDNILLTKVGTPGVSTNASLTLKYSENIPNKLYYNLEKNGIPINLDNEVLSYAEITYQDSSYNGTFNIIDKNNTSFTISLNQYPERLTYNRNQCDVIEYYTNSNTALGGIHRISLSSGGFGYKKIPNVSNLITTNGSGAFIVPVSNSIGRIKQTKTINEGFEYSSDKTLRPIANIAKNLYVSSSNTIKSIEILNSGKNYISPPDVICINSDTGELINSGLLKAKLSGSSIGNIEIVVNPKGLPNNPITLKTINNSNGISVYRVELIGSIVRCTLTTPFGGFGNIPFEVGDQIFVEGIENIDNIGDGLNSSDYEYQFFTITNYYSTDPAILEFDISEYTDNPGIPKAIQYGYATIVNRKNYPQFKVEQEISEFLVGERLLILNGNTNQYEDTDLIIKYSNQNFIKVFGNDSLNLNNIIKGVESSNIATIDLIQSINGIYNTNYFNRQNNDWQYNTGKLSDDTQRLPDNDYYQNLSYTVKSTKTWEEIVTPVNNLLHTSGLKNFADTQIISSPLGRVGPGIGTTEALSNILIKDYISDLRVDTINNLDLVLDVDTLNGKSKFLEFNTLNLSDYILCKTNRVLKIDDISNEFSSYDDERDQDISNILTLEKRNRYNKFLVLIQNKLNNEIQFSEIVTINNNKNAYNLVKNNIVISNNKPYLVNVSGYINESQNFYLKLEPYDTENSAFDIKILQNTFNSVGIASTQSVGFVDLISTTKSINANATTNILEFNKTKYTSFFVNIHVTNDNGSIINYIEIYLTHNGTDTYLNEYYFDNSGEENNLSIGTFSSDISGGKVYLTYTNNLNEKVNLNLKSTSFGDTNIGFGTYRFKVNGQSDGNERTVVYNSQNTSISSGSTVVLSLDKNIFSAAKSLVQIGYGNTSALHQVLSVFDGVNSHTIQGPFLSIGSTTGIGTFGSEISGNNFNVVFYPNTQNNELVNVLSFNESFYKDLDKINIPPDLKYGSITESVKLANYYGTNLQNIDRLDFELNYQGQPIFVKTFNPENSEVLTLSSGQFNIKDHFFSTGEELIYRPKSTFIGVGTAPMGIGATLNYVGVVTTLLPEIVYAIKDDNTTFRLATRKEYALSGIGVTFTSYGLGNAHELEMSKKNEKSLITINNLIQYPISYSLVSYTLNGNGGQIGASSTIFALSGITSIRINDILKIDNEYLNVNNVGLGTTNIGPITYAGNVPLVEATRGFLGSLPGIHTDSSSVGVYRGSYNISGNKIYFTQAPRGNSLDLIYPNDQNLSRERAEFNGRVFLRNDYTTNQIYDDISDQFTGIANTFRLTKLGINTVGLGTTGGNGIVLINSIFQSPTTTNNSKNNYIINENLNSGITSITFTGITSANTQNIFISDSDINQNQLPRGGMIVSLGSSIGLGYEPGVYEDLSVIGVSRIGIGQTTETGVGLLLNVEVSPSSSTGIGSTLFEINSFKVTRNGYGFRKGDVFKPVGLVTASGLSSPINEFTLTVLETFNDSFACWQFGELDYIDSVKSYQDGIRTRFPLYYRGELLSFQNDSNNSDSQLIDLDSVLLIFINGILQEPSVAYRFSGGTSFEFTTPPKVEDNVSIFFYRGTINDDSFLVNVNTVIKTGDNVQVFSNNDITSTITQDKRIVYNITSSNTIETETYKGLGIDENNLKPLYWTKQKTDLIINNEEVSKSRDSLESQIFPTANIIRGFTSSSTELFVDNTELFEYESNSLSDIDAIIYHYKNNSVDVETIKNISNIEGFTCPIVGISTTTGIGAPLALKFNIITSPSNLSELKVGYPIYINNTNVGSGVTSLGVSQSDIVAISTSFLNNIYYVHAYNAITGIITCNISTSTNIVGITTIGTEKYPVGNISWGRLSGFSRSSSPISIGVSGYTSSIGITTNGYSSGLSTYPTIQRRKYGLRDTGALAKKLN